MPELTKVIAQIAELDPIQREELLFVLSGEVFHPMLSRSFPFSAVEHPVIVSTPGVCGGSPRFIRTRIPVWVLERMRQLGVSEIDIMRSYPTLQAADLAQAWSYVARHREDIEKEILENERE